jgi:predicted PurR-regulated permease PerM
MTSNTVQEKAQADTTPSRSTWTRRFLITLTVLGCLAIGAAAVYGISLISEAVIILIVSVLLAYLNYPLVQFLQRRLAPPLAVAIAYLVVTIIIIGGLSLVVVPLIQQSSSLAQFLKYLASPAGKRSLQPVLTLLEKFGFSQQQLGQFRDQAVSQLLQAFSGTFPFLLQTINNITGLVIVITLSVYFVVDGPRIIRWLCKKTPLAQRSTINFLVHTLDQSIGGYFRGSLILAAFGAVSTGLTLTLLHVPYATLLGLLFFLLFFIPVIGGIVIGVLCILAALSQGLLTALIVAIFMTLLQSVVLGQILLPRVYSRTVGIHPIVAILALLVGLQLFGVLGGILSVPVAGVLQQIIVALWQRWKAEHPEQFPAEDANAPEDATAPHAKPVTERP